MAGGSLQQNNERGRDAVRAVQLHDVQTPPRACEPVHLQELQGHSLVRALHGQQRGGVLCQPVHGADVQRIVTVRWCVPEL